MDIRKLAKAILIFIGYIIVPGVIAFLLQCFGLETVLGEDLFLTLVYVLVFAFYIYIFREKYREQWSDAYKNRKSYIKLATKYWFIGYILMIIANLIVTQILGPIAPNESVNRDILVSYPVYAITNMCFIGPILEETLFRLNFREFFKNKRTFVIVTGTIFALFHVIFSLSSASDLLYIFPYLTLGITFSAIYAKTDNIFASIFAHILHNSLVILIIKLAL